MFKYYRLQYFLLSLALCLLPFNALPLFNNALGEATGEGALYPILFGVLLFLFKKVHDVIEKRELLVRNRKVWLILIAFIVLIIVSFGVNYNQISTNLYLGKNGLVRYVTQAFLFFFTITSIFFIADAVKDKVVFGRLLKISNRVFWFVLLFAIFQFVVYYTKVGMSLYYIIGSIIYEDGVIDFALYRREGYGLHSVSQEPSFLAMYLAVMLPFVILGCSSALSRIFTLMIAITLVVLTWSKTSYVVTLIQLSVLVFFYHYHYLTLKKVIVISLLLFVGAPLVWLVLLSGFNVEESGSSAARLGAAYSALSLWLDGHVYFGVGLGQAGYSLIDYLPRWAFFSGDTVDVVDGLRWPPIHNFWIRIVSEVGIGGLLMFFTLFIYMISKVNGVIKFKYTIFREKDFLGYAVLISLIGAILIMFNRETISNMNIWLSLGFALAYLNINKQKGY